MGAPVGGAMMAGRDAADGTDAAGRTDEAAMRDGGKVAAVPAATGGTTVTDDGPAAGATGGIGIAAPTGNLVPPWKGSTSSLSPWRRESNTSRSRFV